MLNFDNDSDLRDLPTSQRVRVEVPVVQERVTVTPMGVSSAPTPVVSSPTFEWERVRDYVIAKIVETHGVFPRDIRSENTIFMAFAARWEGLAMKIARYAFENAGGEWLGSPVAVHRFSKVSDPVFATRIAVKI